VRGTGLAKKLRGRALAKVADMSPDVHDELPALKKSREKTYTP
jgi:hypothetical protein